MSCNHPENDRVSYNSSEIPGGRIHWCCHCGSIRWTDPSKEGNWDSPIGSDTNSLLAYARTVASISHENVQLQDQVTSLQARGTELIQSNRAMVRLLKELCPKGEPGVHYSVNDLGQQLHDARERIEALLQKESS